MLRKIGQRVVREEAKGWLWFCGAEGRGFEVLPMSNLGTGSPQMRSEGRREETSPKRNCEAGRHARVRCTTGNAWLGNIQVKSKTAGRQSRNEGGNLERVE
jgi:hypothetical protein